MRKFIKNGICIFLAFVLICSTAVMGFATELNEEMNNPAQNEIMNSAVSLLSIEEEPLTGWQTDEETGDRYYYDETGEVVKGIVVIEESTYCFDEETGAMKTGWQRVSDVWRYFGTDDGIMKTGWQKIKGKWYYLGTDGIMKTGWIKLSNKWYYLGTANDGAMKSDWQKVNNKWYYFGSANDGAMKTDWQKIKDKWYYFGTADDGAMKSGWLLNNNSWYYLGSANDGSMKTGWVLDNNKWYYLGDDGVMRTGWAKVDNKLYYLYKNGSMASNTTIDGLTVGASGALTTNNVKANMLTKAQGYSSNTSYLILTDTNACKVSIYTGKKNNWSLLCYWDCAPGKNESPTKKGEFTVQGKGYYFNTGTDLRCFYYTQFYGNYLFHSVLYKRDNTPKRVVDGRVGQKLSHGCVRLKVENAKWIYDNIPKNTKVIIY